jgi:predicted TIM-barrel fold metal-dependent hydrolase
MIRHFWGMPDLERQPSEYMKEHTSWGTLWDPVGVQMRDAIGAGKIMFSTDFPHAAGDWPDSQKVIDDMFAAVPEPDKHMILAGNAVKYWHLDE